MGLGALILIVIVLAIVGGFIGDLLEFTAWLIAIMAIIGGLIGFLLYRGYQKLKSKVT